MKYLYDYECDKEHLSTKEELQIAIDGNRREGRRSSYGHFDGMDGMSPPPPDSVVSGNGGGRNHLSHTSPLSLVSRAGQTNGHNSQDTSSGQ